MITNETLSKAIDEAIDHTMLLVTTWNDEDDHAYRAHAIKRLSSELKEKYCVDTSDQDDQRDSERITK